MIDDNFRQLRGTIPSSAGLTARYVRAGVGECDGTGLSTDLNGGVNDDG